jgi:LemA protein
MPIAGIIIIAVIAVIVIWFITAYNSFIRARTTVEEAFSTMDVYMKKRFDLIPNLVETVKGYASHERETLQNVVNARAQVAGAASLSERAKSENMLSDTLKTLFAVAENYPDLKANQNFLELQSELRRAEEDIANSRKYYNAVVKNYNNRCQMFPSNLVASLFHFTPKTMFEVASAAERENVKVDFKTK